MSHETAPVLFTSCYAHVDMCISWVRVYMKVLILIVTLESPLVILSFILGADDCVLCQRSACHILFSDCAWHPEVWGLTGSDSGPVGSRCRRGGAAGPAQGPGAAVFTASLAGSAVAEPSS